MHNDHAAGLALHQPGAPARRMAHPAANAHDHGVTSVLLLYQGTTSVVPNRPIKEWALAPVMAIPSRNDGDAKTAPYTRTFFVTTKTSMGQHLLQSDRFAELFIDVLRNCIAAKRFQVHDFVIMPDHVHLLLSVRGDMSIEKAMQFIKGGFSYRVKKEFGYAGEVWQRGFSEVRVDGQQSFERHREYIAQNPARAGLVRPEGLYPWCFETLHAKKAAGAKAPP
ncbi:MAG: transposase [Acidobacteriaceae bacterium]